MPAPKRRGLWVGLAVAFLALLVFNLSVGAPVAMRLAQDARNGGITLVAYRSLAIQPQEITLDVWDVSGDSAPLDLFRVLMQSAEALKGRSFSRVTLAHKGRAVFRLEGRDFRELGEAYSSGENPLYLIRMLPERLKRPDGTAAFGSWEGGFLGVLLQQMTDANRFAAWWATGAEPPAESSYP